MPPHVHRRNAAERAIRTFKNHFIAGLCSTDKGFPLTLWDKLLPQAELTLNLLRGSRVNPKLSAWAQLHGTYDFNRTPIAPPGMRVVAHEKPSQRESWAPHGADGWYIGPAMESYRCYTIWISGTKSARICDTVAWYPDKIRMPTPSTQDLMLASLNDIRDALQNPTPAAPVSDVTDNQADKLRQITELLHNIVIERARATETRPGESQPDDQANEGGTAAQGVPNSTAPEPDGAPPERHIPTVEPDDDPPAPNPAGADAPTLRVGGNDSPGIDTPNNQLPPASTDTTTGPAPPAEPATPPQAPTTAQPNVTPTYASVTGPAARRQRRR